MGADQQNKSVRSTIRIPGLPAPSMTSTLEDNETPKPASLPKRPPVHNSSFSEQENEQPRKLLVPASVRKQHQSTIKFRRLPKHKAYSTKSLSDDIDSLPKPSRLNDKKELETTNPVSPETGLLGWPSNALPSKPGDMVPCSTTLVSGLNLPNDAPSLLTRYTHGSYLEPWTTPFAANVIHNGSSFLRSYAIANNILPKDWYETRENLSVNYVVALGKKQARNIISRLSEMDNLLAKTTARYQNLHGILTNAVANAFISEDRARTLLVSETQLLLSDPSKNYSDEILSLDKDNQAYYQARKDVTIATYYNTRDISLVDQLRQQLAEPKPTTVAQRRDFLSKFDSIHQDNLEAIQKDIKNSPRNPEKIELHLENIFGKL